MPTEIKKKRRVNARDFDETAQFICDELDTRRKDRKDLEEDWKEVDKQLAMDFDASWKKDESGRYKAGLQWMPEIPLPLQAQTLEILTADARRMIDPTVGPWFRAHALASKEYFQRLDALDGLEGLIAGEGLDLPAEGLPESNQDNADKILESILRYIHDEQAWWQQWDAFNAEAFAYGTAVGRVRVVKKPAFIEQSRGLAKINADFPVFFPRSIKDTYLDDTPQRVMNEGHMIGPAVIHVKKQKLADLSEAARKGTNDPESETGGWMPSKLKELEADDKGNVDVIEWEGDLIITRKTTENIFVPNVIVTVAKQNKAKVIRFRFRKTPFTSYIAHPYHVERSGTPYGVSPLMKGAPLQKAATDIFGRLLQSGILNTEPPIQYDPDDPNYAGQGGPIIEPRALWAAAGEIIPHEIGNPAALMQVYLMLVQHYADVTGMHAPRLGQQTVSHTTAFAKEAELSRGQVRTVDYANSLIQNPLKRTLEMQFWHLKNGVWNERRNVYVPDFKGFIRVGPEAIPEEAEFEVFGSAGPADRRSQTAEQLQAIQIIVGLEEAKLQLQQGEPLDFAAIQKHILRRVGYPDADAFFTQQPQVQNGAALGGPGVQDAVGISPGVNTAAIQAFEQ